MKHASLLLALLFTLCGCSGRAELDEALALRSRLLSTGCSFTCHITADYSDRLQQFSLSCSAQGEELSFCVESPESIQGIRGHISQDEGALHFDGEILAFPLLAGDRLSPVSAPYFLLKALRSGYITACGREGEGLRISVNDSYADDALTLEVWTDGSGHPVAAEIGWQGRRMVSMEVEGFAFS